MKMIKRNIYNILFLIVSLTSIFLLSYKQLEKVRISTDFVSFALSGVAPLLKIGMPYVDYWGINPPGLLSMLMGWALLFGYSIQSWHILYLLLLVAINLFVWIILRRTFTKFESISFFLLWTLFFYSNAVQSQFFPSEINGLFFSLLGVILIFKQNVTYKSYFFASFCFILAGQMKEVYILSGLTLFPHLLQKLRQDKVEILKFILSVVLGISSALLLLYFYLLAMGSLSEYLSILEYKSEQFSITELNVVLSKTYLLLQFPANRFFHLQYELLLLIAINICTFLIWLSYRFTLNLKYFQKILKDISHKNIFVYLLTLFYFLGSFFGYLLQGRMGNKYDIAILFPYLLFLILNIKELSFMVRDFTNSSKINYFLKIITYLIIVLMLFPKKYYFENLFEKVSQYSPGKHYHMFLNAEDPIFLRLEKRIQSMTSKDDCITKVYGWGVGDAYYYSERKSCSKHFLINLLPKEMYDSYVDELLDNPPKAIIYTREETDFDFMTFEKEIFNFQNVIDSCYKQDSEFEELYWALYKENELIECLTKNI